MLHWSGHDFTIKTTGDGERTGPGPNYFAASGVRVDRDGLHLKAEVKDGRLYCAEVVSTESFGYGAFRFEIASDAARIDRNLVLGLFVWSDSPEYNHREIDFAEVSRWGRADNDNMQVVVQPPSPETLIRFMLPPGRLPSVHSATWTDGRVTFETRAANRVVKRGVFTRRIPKAGGEQVRLNLWCMAKELARDGMTEVVVKSFRFTPAK